MFVLSSFKFRVSSFAFCAATLFAQPTEWSSRGIGGGGALFFPSLSPHNAGELFITCDMAEYFHSADNGESWTIPDWRELVSTSRGRVLFTNNPDVLYVLDGSGDTPTPSKSLDGGVTWTPIASDPTDGDAYSLFADPSNESRLLVASYTQLFFSGDGGATFNARFTDNNGLHIAGALYDSDTIYVGTSAGLLRSINGGLSFSLWNNTGIPAGEAMISFVGARTGSTVRLFALTGGDADVYPGIWGIDYSSFQAIYSLDVGQNSWVLRSGSLDPDLYPFFLSMAVNDINTVYASGSDNDTFAPLVLKSADGGNTWANVFQSVNNQNIFTGWCGDHGDLNWGWAEAALGFGCASNEPDRAIVSDFGFAHLTTDGGVTWKQIYTSTADQNPPGAWTPKWQFYHGIGLEPTGCWNLFWSDSLHLFAGYSDIVGTRSTDGGLSWARTKIDTTRTFSVNCVYRTIRVANGTLFAATSSIHDLYQSTYLTDARIDGGTGQLWASDNNGVTWTMRHNFAHPVIWLATDPTNENRLYACVVHSTLGGIYVSTDDGFTWSPLSHPPRTEGHAFNVHVLNDGTVVCTYSGRRANNVFTQSSGVFVSTDEGNTWTDRSSSEMLYWTKDLIIDPHDAAQNTWFVAVHRGWGGAPNELGGLFQTTNRGLTWTQISDLLYAESFAASPVDSNEGYLTTETEGLWLCSNLRSATPTFTQVAEYPFVRPNRVFYNPFNPNEIWVASFGNGLRMGSALTALEAVNDLTVYPSGSDVTLRWSPVSGAQSYLIYGSVTPDFQAAEWLGTTGNTTFAHTPVAPVYHYRLIASDQSP